MSVPYDGEVDYGTVNAYATVLEIKKAMRVPDSDTVDDDLLSLSLTAASRTIDEHCNRRFFTNGTETRVYVASDHYIVEVDDLASVATVKTSTALNGTYDVTWGVADYQTEPLNESPVTRLRAVDNRSWPVDYSQRHRAGVEVTGVFGYGTAVPTDVRHATILLAMRLWKRFDSPTGVAGFGPDLGVVRVSRVDPDVAAMLAPYRRDPIGLA
jgi:hypothetical protein